MIARYASSIATGSAVTFGLFYVMHLLIALQPGIIAEARPPFEFNIFRPERERPIEQRETLPDNDYIETPTTPDRPIETIDGTTVGLQIPRHNPTPGTKLNGIDLRLTDGPLVTVMRVEPNYPPSLAQKGIEGHVIVRFDVMRDGGVENVSVVESSHRGFERSALSAAQRFRFKARVVDGVPQVTTGVRYLFRFEMTH